MSGSSDDECANLPSAQECEERCQAFASVTGTDTALAMFYLQDRDWNVERALNAYFEESGASQSNAVGLDENDITGENETTEEDKEPFRIRLMSWNIDGLDLKNLQSRTEGVCDTINKEEPHVVFLQELIPDAERIIEQRCPLYNIIPAGSEGYYVAMMLKSGPLVRVEETRILPYPNTMMTRNLLAVKCTVKGEKFCMMTSHLESTKDYAKARKEQLKKCFTHMSKVENDRTVLFGGDLNLRDKEVQEIGGIPEGIYDVWDITGQRKEAKFTWDTLRNDNLEFGQFKPRCRFDRIYIQHSVPKVVKPEYFELVGIERLTSCHRFPSDHWALLTHINILSKVPK
ncbi:Tyrosyl-DNA phosphodiesterase 2 [Mactra antiquata]